MTPTKIEVRLSKYSMSYFSNKASEKASDKIRNKTRSRKNTKNELRRSSKQSLKSGILKGNQLLAATSTTSQSSINSKRSLYSDTILAGNINLVGIDVASEKEKLDIQKINSEYQDSLEKKADLNSKAFSKLYNSMIEMNEDPAKIFQQGFNKISHNQKKGGIIS
jgi:hypothetical protein